MEIPTYPISFPEENKKLVQFAVTILMPSIVNKLHLPVPVISSSVEFDKDEHVVIKILYEVGDSDEAKIFEQLKTTLSEFIELPFVTAECCFVHQGENSIEIYPAYYFLNKLIQSYLKREPVILPIPTEDTNTSK